MARSYLTFVVAGAMLFLNVFDLGMLTISTQYPTLTIQLISDIATLVLVLFVWAFLQLSHHLHIAFSMIFLWRSWLCAKLVWLKPEEIQLRLNASQR